ncbi:MAG: ABC transporter permease [Egibacteraceae bacterium]
MEFLNYLGNRWPNLVEQGIEHAYLVAVPVIVGTVISLTLGIVSYHSNWFRSVTISVTSTFLTIPSFALFVLFIPFVGIGAKPAMIGLTMYCLLPITRNTIAGLRGVDQAVVESAKGMGLNARQRLLRIELPLAWPVIITGIRVATQITVGIAAIGVFVNAGGLGEDIMGGLSRLGSAQAVNITLGGTVGIVVIALIFDAFLFLIQKLTTSRGLRD